MKTLESTRGEDIQHTANTTTQSHTMPKEKGGEGLIGRDLELSSIYSEDFLDTDCVGEEKGATAIESEETSGEKVGTVYT